MSTPTVPRQASPARVGKTQPPKNETTPPPHGGAGSDTHARDELVKQTRAITVALTEASNRLQEAAIKIGETAAAMYEAQVWVDLGFDSWESMCQQTLSLAASMQSSKQLPAYVARIVKANTSLSSYKVAALVGKTRSYVSQFTSDPSRSKKSITQKKQLVRQLSTQGKTQTEIAHMLSMSQSEVSRLLAQQPADPKPAMSIGVAKLEIEAIRRAEERYVSDASDIIEHAGRLFHGRAWESLGFGSWQELCGAVIENTDTVLTRLQRNHLSAIFATAAGSNNDRRVEA